MNGLEKWGPTEVSSPHDIFGMEETWMGQRNWEGLGIKLQLEDRMSYLISWITSFLNMAQTHWEHFNFIQPRHIVVPLIIQDNPAKPSVCFRQRCNWLQLSNAHKFMSNQCSIGKKANMLNQCVPGIDIEVRCTPLFLTERYRVAAQVNRVGVGEASALALGICPCPWWTCV